jgi:hypothetical protein
MMKKTITAAFIILFLLPAGHSLRAQQKFSVGIQGGLGGAFTENSYTGGNEYTTDMLLGIPEVYPVWSHMYNLYFSYGINNGFGIALEPGIIRKGYGSKRVSERGDVVFDRRQTEYLQLPLLLEFSPAESVRLTAGPEFGYLRDKKMRTNHNRLDLGIQVGGYYTLKKHLDVGIKIGAAFTGGDKYYLTNDAGEVLTEVFRRNYYAGSFIRVKL